MNPPFPLTPHPYPHPYPHPPLSKKAVLGAQIEKTQRAFLHFDIFIELKLLVGFFLFLFEIWSRLPTNTHAKNSLTPFEQEETRCLQMLELLKYPAANPAGLS